MTESQWWNKEEPCPTCGAARVTITDEVAMRAAVAQHFLTRDQGKEGLRQRVASLKELVGQIKGLAEEAWASGCQCDECFPRMGHILDLIWVALLPTWVLEEST